MKTRLLLAASAVTWAAVTVAACANDEGATDLPPPDPGQSVPESGSDGDAGNDGDAGPCDDCEYYPPVCSEDVLCLNGPFEPDTIGGAFDSRARVHTIQGRSVSDVWAAGALGMIAHFDGTTWSRSDPGTAETMRALWLRDKDEIAFGRPNIPYTRGIAVADAAVSDGGWTQQRQVLVSASYVNSTKNFVAAWAPPEAEWLWLTTESTYATSALWRLRRSSSGTFEIGVGIPWEVCSLDFQCNRLTRIHGSSADDLWAVGPVGRVVHVTGAQGDTPIATPFNARTTDALRGVWAASPSDVWAVGAVGTIRHYTGDPLFWDIVTDVPTTVALNAVWGTSPSDVWAVGDGAVVLHYDGTRWSRVAIAGLEERRPNLEAVWSPGPGHVWIGGQGVVLSLGGKP